MRRHYIPETFGTINVLPLLPHVTCEGHTMTLAHPCGINVLQDTDSSCPKTDDLFAPSRDCESLAPGAEEEASG